MSEPESAAGAVPGAKRSLYILVIFTALYMMMYADRQVLNLILESVKHEMQLSDTVLALITGFGYSFFHTALGLPAARLADKGDRRIIITITTALWSGLTLLTGFVQNAIQLTLARIGVGIGESASPILHSILADNSSRKSRGAVLSLFTLGSPLAALLVFPLIGWVDHHYGWRWAFIVAGLPGLVIGALIFFTFRDHTREVARKAKVKAPPLDETLRFLFSQRTFCLTVLGYVVSQIGVQGFTTWAPTFLRRVHHFDSAQVGSFFGLTTGLLGIAGGVCGALAMQYSNRQGEHWKLLWPALSTFLIGPFILLTTFAQNPTALFLSIGMVSFMVAFKFGQIVAANQSVAPSRMRSLSSSMQGLSAALIAVGGGPLMVGALTDHLTPQFGQDALRYSLLAPIGFVVVGSIILALGARSYAADAARAEAMLA